MRRTVELISTGSELLCGRTLNRHALTLGENLHPLGFELVRDTTVPDDVDVIRATLAEALSRVDIVFVTGGLGPTSDDVTREAIAGLLGRKVVMDNDSVGRLRERYVALGRTITPQLERQALVVEGSVALPNSVGAAPGERLELDGKVIFVLPGPPRELFAILTEYVIPWLRQSIGAQTPAEKIFLLCGIAESDIVARFERAGFAPAGMAVAYCAAPGRVEIRLVPTKAGADVEGAAKELRRLVGEFVFAEERVDMAEVIGRLLSERNAKLATAESCTGGLIGHRITSIAGSSAYYLGGTVAYANEVKVRELGVKEETLATFGAVSSEVAGEMASGARKRFGAEYGLSVTGIAGPGGGSPEKPVGLVYIGVADEVGVFVKKFQFGGGREYIKTWTGQMALNALRLRLLGREW